MTDSPICSIFANFIFVSWLEFQLQLATLVMDEKIVGEVQDNVRLTMFRDQFVPNGQWQAEQCFGLEFDSPLGLADDGSQLWNPFDPANTPDCKVNLTKKKLLLSLLQAICWSLPDNNIVLHLTLYALIIRSKK